MKEGLPSMRNNPESAEKELFRLLIFGKKERFTHLEGFCYELEKRGVKTRLIDDMEFLNKTFEINFKTRIEKNLRIKQVLKNFQPNLVLFDRITKVTEYILKQNIPIIILLRGNYWEEARIAKENTNSRIQKIAIEKNIKLNENCFKNSSLILPISKYLQTEVKRRYPNNAIELFPGDGRIPTEWKIVNSRNLKHPCIGLLQGLNIWGKTKELILLKKALVKFPEITFYLAGDGEYNQKIIPELESFENFVWLKNLEYPKQVIEFLSEIDIYLLLTGLEGLGQTIIEAALLKKPIIASNTGGVSDLIKNDETGFLIDEDNGDMLIEKINICLNDKEVLEKITINAHLDIKNRFSWNTLSGKFIEIILSNFKEFMLNK